MSNKARPTVCLVDDDAAVREAFAVLLKSAGLKLMGPKVVALPVLAFHASFDPQFLTNKLEFRKALVLADFVANRDLRLKRDLGSDPALWERLRAAAKRAGVAEIMSSSTQGVVEDDHTPFMKAGVPAIDLIDFDFPQWHTLQDRPNVLSKRSLDAAGEAVVELMRELRRR